MRQVPKILIVDDESDILEFLSYNFQKKGFQVNVAKNGIEGLSVAQQFFPDVIITDVLMPEMDGITFTKRLKSTDNLKNTPVIVLSAINNEFRVLNSMDSGADEFVSKPVRFDILHAIVNIYLNT
jgi:two-component system, OmpR family, alkaline phosphatase synthesis response regulator PhoP